jgi:transcriptional regulator GlxA family with amidase domain
MDWRIRRAIDIMQHDLAAPCRLSSLAERVNLSPSRFSHLFRHELGVSPARYLRDLRLDAALMLLHDSPSSIKQIMAAVGFNDPSHFTRDFVKRHDVTPTEYRQRARGGSPATSARILPLSSSIRQQTVSFANDPELADRPASSIFKRWRDERAKGA